MKKIIPVMLIVMIFLVLSNAAIGEEGKNTPIEKMQYDLSVPESPALAALGVTAETVIHPTSPRALAAALLNGVDANGNFQSGFALDTAPYLLFFGQSVKYKDYEDSYWEQLATRTQFSIAMTKGANEDDKSHRIGLGLRFTLWDKGDPRLDRDLLGCLTKGAEFSKALEELKQVKAMKDGIGKLKEDIAKLEEREDRLSKDEKEKLLELKTKREIAKEKIAIYKNQDIDELIEIEQRKAEERIELIRKKCIDEAAIKNWNASSLSLGIAPTWTSPEGSTEDLEWSGVALYGTLAYGFEQISGLKDRAQFLLHARFRSEELAPDPDEEGDFLEQDTFIAGAQLRIGPTIGSKVGGRDFSLSLEGDYLNVDPDEGKDDSFFRYSISADIEIVDNIYFRLSYGGESGIDRDDEDAFVIGNLKFGL